MRKIRARFLSFLKFILLCLFVGFSYEPAYAHSSMMMRMTSIGLVPEYTDAKSGQFQPGLSISHGILGIGSLFATMDLGYRIPEQTFFARGLIEAYLMYFGGYVGIQTNFAKNQGTDAGLAYGIGVMLPVEPVYARFRLGRVSYYTDHENEFQLSLTFFILISTKEL